MSVGVNLMMFLVLSFLFERLFVSGLFVLERFIENCFPPISSKYTSFYEDFPLPKDASDYPSHKELLKYFNDYADHFDINRLIKFGTEVLHCKYTDDNKWIIQWRSLDSENINEDKFDALVVCNGHHHEPRYPSYPGDFSGEYLHSHD